MTRLSRVVEKLESRGFDIIEASSGEEALDLTLDHTFDLVVSDIEMEAITGVQLCRVFRGDPAMADIAFVCDFGQFLGERAGRKALSECGLAPISDGGPSMGLGAASSAPASAAPASAAGALSPDLVEALVSSCLPLQAGTRVKEMIERTAAKPHERRCMA